jgi:hypothetical protein
LAADTTAVKATSLGEVLRQQPCRPPVAALSHVLSHEGEPDAFWAALAAQPGFEEAAARDELRFTLQASALADSHLPTLTALQAFKAARGLKTARELVTLTPADLATVAPPEGFESSEDWAQEVVRRIHRVFPTEGLFARLDAATPRLPIAADSDLVRLYRHLGLKEVLDDIRVDGRRQARRRAPAHRLAQDLPRQQPGLHLPDRQPHSGSGL